MICVGGGSMKKFGFLDRAISYLKEAGMEVELFEGIEPDPSVETVMRGAEAMLKLYENYRGDKIECPMKLYRAEYIADLVSQTTDRKKRAEIARAGGYALKFIEGIIQRRKKESGK